MQKWFAAIEIFVRNEKLLSVRKLADVLEINKDTAWAMMLKIKKAAAQYGELFVRLVESGEIYLRGGIKAK